MRYQNLFSFQRHLEAAAPNHLCKIYLIAMQNDFERAKVIFQICSYFSTLPQRLNVSEHSIRQILDASRSMSLLGESFVILDEMEKLSKKDLDLLAQNLKETCHLIFGCRSKLSSFFEAVEKEGVILDLLSEKPWEKEKRLTQEVVQTAAYLKKTISLETAQMLLERIGSDPALLESEIQKLICYVGDRNEIVQEDVLSIAQESRAASFWKTAEEVIWEKGSFNLLDSNAFHALVPALRNQLHIGLTLSTLIEEKRAPSEWSQFLPKLFAKTLEKRASQAAKFGSSYFQNGLKALFEIEFASRTQSSHFEALLELFRVKLYALFASESTR